MGSIFISWPTLGLKVTCDPIAENVDVFNLVSENLPIKALQGHEIVGGWMLRDRVLHMVRKPYDIENASEIAMCDAPEGTLCLCSPQGSTGELVIKYGDCVDDRKYIPFAQVRACDMDTLKKAGKAAWKSAARTKDVIISVIEKGE